jgi:hypothetical protein
MVIYKKPLGKLFALCFVNGYLEKIVSKIHVRKNR